MKRVLIPLLAATAGVLAGCGAEVQPRGDSGPIPVTIENCGREITYPMPKRAVAYDMSATEKMFALGLADQMRGIVLPKTAEEPAERSPYKDDYERVEVLSDDVLSREVVVDVKADWVLAGWNSGFSEERGVTPDLLDQVGIKSYMYTETCFDYGDNPARVRPLQALYTDLEQIGEIFHIERRAERLVADLKYRVEALRKRQPETERARVFVYDSGTDEPFTSGNQTTPHTIVTLAGGDHIFSGLDQRWTTVGWEAVVKAKPEVIAVVDYGDQPVEDKIAYLKSLPALAESPAVRNNRFYVLDYGQAVTSPRSIEGAEDFARYLRSIGR